MPGPLRRGGFPQGSPRRLADVFYSSPALVLAGVLVWGVAAWALCLLARSLL